MKKVIVSLVFIILLAVSACNDQTVETESPAATYTNEPIDPLSRTDVLQKLESVVYGKANTATRVMATSVGEVDLSTALEVSDLTDGAKRYTFRVADEGLAFGYKNLILLEHPQNGLSGYTIRYEPDMDWLLASETIDMRQFTGQVFFTNLSGVDIYRLDAKAGFGGLAVLPQTEADGRVACGGVNNGGGNPTGGGFSDWGGWGDFGNYYGGVFSGSGGGGSGGGGGGTLHLNPTPPAELQKHKHMFVRTACGGLPEGGNCDPNDEVGCTSPIGVLGGSGSINDIIDKELDDLSFSYLRDKYAPRMTPKELKYFDENLSYSQKIKFLRSAYRAERATEDINPQYYYGGHNDEWDAFRHAYFHGLLSKKIGIALSKILGDLHEDWNGNPTLERQMDLFNNQIGRDVYNDIINISDHFYDEGLMIRIMKLLYDGGLREIKNGQLKATP